VAALLRTAKDRLASLLSSAHYKKRAVIALDADAEQVSIIAMFYVGQDYETSLQGDSEGWPRALMRLLSVLYFPFSETTATFDHCTGRRKEGIDGAH
jgi:hypothetical protein